MTKKRSVYRGAAGIIYRAAIWMKLNDSSPVERKTPQIASTFQFGHGHYVWALWEHQQKQSTDTIRNWRRSL